MRNLTERISPTSRVVILVIAALFALVLLVFFLWSPIKPTYDNESPFGVPQESVPKRQGK